MEGGGDDLGEPHEGQRLRRNALVLLCFAGIACARHAAAPVSTPLPVSAAPAATRFYFVDVAAQAGVTRVTWAGRPGKDHLLDSAGTGAAFLDYDRDGRLDLYIVNRSEEHTSELQSPCNLVCRLLLEK